MDCYGVFGNPIAHSLSPVIHTQFARDTDLCIDYQKILCPINDFSAKARAFVAQGALGFNISVPFKLQAFELATQHTENAKSAKSVNTIKVDGSVLIGENTDGIGLVNDLCQNLKLDISNKTLLILGAGGATRGILRPLLEQQPKRLMIANRTAITAIKLAKEFSTFGETCGFGLEKIKNQPVDIIVNASSASLAGIMPDIANGVANSAICYDLMYNTQTPFMTWAQDNNAKMVVDGLGMLVEQAAASFEFWTGEKPDTQKIIKDLRR